MVSESIPNPKRIVVLIEEHDGSQRGWEVTPPMSAAWHWTGVGPNGSTGRIEASGTFYRKRRAGEIINELDEAQRALLPGGET